MKITLLAPCSIQSKKVSIPRILNLEQNYIYSAANAHRTFENIITLNAPLIFKCKHGINSKINNLKFIHQVNINQNQDFLHICYPKSIFYLLPVSNSLYFLIIINHCFIDYFQGIGFAIRIYFILAWKLNQFIEHTFKFIILEKRKTVLQQLN